MKKINWLEIVIGLAVLIGITFLLLYKIKDQYMWTDEVYSFEATKNIIEKGNTIFVTGMNYSRASIYHHLLALSMEIFGEDEFGSRIINIPFILGTMVLIYIILRKKNKLLGLCSSALYATTNFTIALVRETRMYSMTTFFLALTAIAVYKGFVDVKKGTDIKIKDMKWKINIPWIIIAGISFYIMYDTQPLTILFGFGLILFYLLISMLQRKKEDLFVLGALIVLGMIGIYLKYKTLNPVDVYFALSPDWAANYPPAIPYYSFILAWNIPWCFVSIPITMFIISKYREKKNIYIFSIFFSMLLILSIMQVQAERYITPLIPFLITLSSLSLYEFYLYLKENKKKSIKIFIPLIITIMLIPQGIYLNKELNEIETYTPLSLSIYKKYKFNDLRDYLSENLNKDDYLIADFHSAYTLYAMGFHIDYFLLPNDDIHWKWGEYDAYFNIPLMNYEKDLVDFTEEAKEEGKKVHIVIRDENEFDDIDYIFEESNEFTGTPKLFIVQ